MVSAPVENGTATSVAIAAIAISAQKMLLGESKIPLVVPPSNSFCPDGGGNEKNSFDSDGAERFGPVKAVT